MLGRPRPSREARHGGDTPLATLEAFEDALDDYPEVRRADHYGVTVRDLTKPLAQAEARAPAPARLAAADTSESASGAHAAASLPKADQFIPALREVLAEVLPKQGAALAKKFEAFHMNEISALSLDDIEELAATLSQPGMDAASGSGARPVN